MSVNRRRVTWRPALLTRFAMPWSRALSSSPFTNTSRSRWVFVAWSKVQLSRRFPVRILPPVLITQDGKEDVTLFNLTEVDIVRFAVPGGNVLEEENISDETTQQRIMQDKFLNRAALCSEFLLNRTDENSNHIQSYVPAVPQVARDTPSATSTGNWRAVVKPRGALSLKK